MMVREEVEKDEVNLTLISVLNKAYDFVGISHLRWTDTRKVLCCGATRCIATSVSLMHAMVTSLTLGLPLLQRWCRLQMELRSENQH